MYSKVPFSEIIAVLLEGGGLRSLGATLLEGKLPGDIGLIHIACAVASDVSQRRPYIVFG